MIARAKIVGVVAGDQRGAERTGLLFHAVVKIGFAEPISALVRDVSATGFLIEMNTDYPVGGQLELQLPHLKLPSAEVVWNLGSSYGCQFETSIGASDLNSLLAMSNVIWPRFRRQDRVPPTDRRAEEGSTESVEPGLEPKASTVERISTPSARSNNNELPANLKFYAIALSLLFLWALILWGVLAALD